MGKHSNSIKKKEKMHVKNSKILQRDCKFLNTKDYQEDILSKT